MCLLLAGGKVASMVEQFNNLKGSKGSPEPNFDRNVEISAPIPNHYPGKSIPIVKPRSLSPEQELQHSSWKDNPLFSSTETRSSDEDVPEIIKRLSHNGLPSGKQLSDTLSSDMIVNSISNGELWVKGYSAGCDVHYNRFRIGGLRTATCSVQGRTLPVQKVGKAVEIKIRVGAAC